MDLGWSYCSGFKWLLPRPSFRSKMKYPTDYNPIHGNRLHNQAARTLVAISGPVSLLRSSLCPSGQTFSRKCGNVLATGQ